MNQPPAIPTTTVTIAAAIKSTRHIEAVAACPFCAQETRLEYVNEQLVSKTECAHLLKGRVRLDGNGLGMRFAKAQG